MKNNTRFLVVPPKSCLALTFSKGKEERDGVKEAGMEGKKKAWSECSAGSALARSAYAGRQGAGHTRKLMHG